MQYQTEILRFKEGARSRHPSPEATVAAAQPNALSDAGNQIAVVVDLTPQLPYRSREIRSLVMKTYWSSSGSIVARLRRALGAANRHLVTFNRKASSGNKCAGSITCAVLAGAELFLGQVGAAYAYVSHPTSVQHSHPGAPSFEIFPKRDRLLMPLGGAVPPVIHISYTAMVPGSIGCIATTSVAEALVRENWQQILALGNLRPIAAELSQNFAARRVSGSAILLCAEATASDEPVPQAGPAPRQDGARADVPTTTVAASLTPIPRTRGHTTAPEGEPASASNPKPSLPSESPDLIGPPEAAPTTSQDAEAPGRTRPAPERTQQERRPKAPRRERQRPRLSLDRTRDWFAGIGERRRERREAAKAGIAERTTTVERARLRQALRTLIPGRVEGQRTPAERTPPSERTSVMAGLALGLLVIVTLITVTKYLTDGGPLRADELLARARDLQAQAFRTQASEDWRELLNTATRAAQLNPQSAEAQELKLEAQRAIDELESAYQLGLVSLMELGSAPRPRRILVADGWIYVLNTATDAVLAYPLSEDGRATTASVAKTILQRGQTYLGEIVGHLVDFAWIPPSANYPDGAVFIYSDGGALFIYEPDLGLGSISVQHIEGDLAAGNITLMETFGENFYLVHRHLNQILMYEPVNGIYSNSRVYFGEGMAPDLQLALDIAIDGRVYLLMGDGSIQSFFSGSTDPSFQVNGLPDEEFAPLVMDIDQTADTGYIYLADTQQERIVVLDKRGEYMRQYRLTEDELQRIESLTVDRATRVAYLIAENRLYAALLPSLEAQSATQP